MEKRGRLRGGVGSPRFGGPQNLDPRAPGEHGENLTSSRCSPVEV